MKNVEEIKFIVIFYAFFLKHKKRNTEKLLLLNFNPA